MSVGGGFKKGKAEFAMKDIDGNDIKTATESFSYIDGDKVLTVDGIDINTTSHQHGIYFRFGGSEYNIYPIPDAKLEFDGNCYFSDEIYIDGGVHFNGYIYDNEGNYKSNNVTNPDKPSYLTSSENNGLTWLDVNDVHCWQFTKDGITLFIYLADYTGNSATENIFTYLNGPVSEDEFNLRVNKIVNIRGIHPNQYSKECMGAYDITRGAGSSGESVNFAVTFINRDSTGAMNVATYNLEMTSTSYQNAEIKYIF